MLTLSKMVVEVGNAADAARAADYPLQEAARPEAFARGDYYLQTETQERRGGRQPSALWLGADAVLEQLGVRRGMPIDREQLIRALQGQHVVSGEQVRRPGDAQARGARRARPSLGRR